MEKQTICHNRECIINNKDFVLTLENFMPEGYVEHSLKDFKYLLKHGFAVNRQETEDISALQKNDESVFSFFALSSKYQDEETVERLGPTQNTLVRAIKESLVYYNKFYPILSDLGFLHVPEIKWQKTKPSGGYHMWHCEAGDRHVSNRVLAFTYYLNDVEEGGETEFLFQKMRVKPRANTLVLFPAAFTHTHRGNPPLSGDKYLATGWVEF